MSPNNHLIKLRYLLRNKHFHSKTLIFLLILFLFPSILIPILVFFGLTWEWGWKLFFSDTEDCASVVCREGDGCAVEVAASEVGMVGSWVGWWWLVGG